MAGATAPTVAALPMPAESYPSPPSTFGLEYRVAFGEHESKRNSFNQKFRELWHLSWSRPTAASQRIVGARCASADVCAYNGRATLLHIQRGGGTGPLIPRQPFQPSASREGGNGANSSRLHVKAWEM